ncbi:unnamed protein product [Arabis nemorensis]|uniref:CCHC-type domain-containing protein n=1 Tax=Arabis nemorensis TaxID=586526 RepID=A0A565BK75_9BRAS|nr:unnamed protein product [Arabis nemorensis]
MANKLIGEMRLPNKFSYVFAARNIITAKDALSMTEFELMELLDVGIKEVRSAITLISEAASPPCQSVRSLLEQKLENEHLSGHLPTHLKGLDAALCGGIPFGVLTELVGPPGIGKSQFCMKLALSASFPAAYGGLDGRVIYIDVESKFSSRRVIEMGLKSFPEVFHLKGMAQEMAGRILVLRPTSLSNFTKSIQELKDSILQNQVKLLVIDSMAALLSGENKPGAQRHHQLGWHISFLKSLAEFSRIPIVVTNQVRSRNRDETSQYSFQAKLKDGCQEHTRTYDSHLVAALGINWAHAVTIRLVLEAKAGERVIKVAKSPMTPPLAFPFHITSGGISLLSDTGTELKGPGINTIHARDTGKNDMGGGDEVGNLEASIENGAMLGGANPQHQVQRENVVQGVQRVQGPQEAPDVVAPELQDEASSALAPMRENPRAMGVANSEPVGVVSSDPTRNLMHHMLDQMDRQQTAKNSPNHVVTQPDFLREQQKGMSNGKGGNRSGKRGRRMHSEDSPQVCQNCGKAGHLRKESKLPNQGSSATFVTCFSCGEKGHYSSSCPSKHPSSSGKEKFVDRSSHDSHEQLCDEDGCVLGHEEEWCPFSPHEKHVTKVAYDP